MPQTNYGNVSVLPGYAGQRVGVGHEEESLVVTGGQVQIDTITIDSASDDQDYTGTILLEDTRTETGTIDSGTGATPTTIALALANEINTLGLFGALLIAQVLVAVITLTGRDINKSYTISSGADSTAVNTQVASAGVAIPYGAGVVRGDALTDNGYKTCELPSVTSVLPQGWTLTPIANNTTLYEVSVTFHDEKNTTYGPTVFTSDGSATPTEVVTGCKSALDALLPANTVATSGTTTLILTSEIPGIAFTPSIGTIANWTSVVETTPDGGAKYAGVAQYLQDIATSEDDDAAYASQSTASILETEVVNALLDAAISPAPTEPVYLRRVATGSEQAGAYRNSADGTDCFLLPGVSWAGSAYTDKNNNRACRIRQRRVA